MTTDAELQLASAILTGIETLIQQWRKGKVDPVQVLASISAIAPNEAAADAAGQAAIDSNYPAKP